MRFGAFWRRGNANDVQDAENLTTGLIADKLAGWAHDDARGNSHAVLGQYPVGCGVCGIYSWQQSGNWLGCRSKVIEGAAYYMSAMALGAAEDASLAAEIRARFG